MSRIAALANERAGWGGFSCCSWRARQLAAQPAWGGSGAVAPPPEGQGDGLAPAGCSLSHIAQRLAAGTPRVARCWPQPTHVVFPQAHETVLHISSAAQARVSERSSQGGRQGAVRVLSHTWVALRSWMRSLLMGKGGCFKKKPQKADKLLTHRHPCTEAKQASSPGKRWSKQKEARQSLTWPNYWPHWSHWTGT